MTRRAKLFQNGGSQAVRLPREFRFEDQSEVLVYREGDRIVLAPVDSWSDAFLDSLGSLADAPIERPPQPSLRDTRDPFDEPA